MLDIKILKANIEQLILESDNIVIIPHNGIDFDAIASALGISLIARKLKKSYCIVVNDQIYKIDHGVQLIIDEIKNDISIVNREKYLQIKTDNDLYILTDVNKSYLISINDIVNKDRTIIIDHHDEDKSTVETEEKYIDTAVSSCSEIITKLLCAFKIKPSSEISNYLLAGIYLDTNKLTKNVSAETMKVISKLMSYGANMNKVTDLFAEDFISDRRVQDLVIKAKISTFSIAIVGANENMEYTKEELAKVTDYLLKYKVDAAFAVGNIGDGIISVSARAKEKIHVGKVMENLQGGGNQYSAATKIKGSTIDEIVEKLKKIVEPACYIG